MAKKRIFSWLLLRLFFACAAPGILEEGIGCDETSKVRVRKITTVFGANLLSNDVKGMPECGGVYCDLDGIEEIRATLLKASPAITKGGPKIEPFKDWEKQGVGPEI